MRFDSLKVQRYRCPSKITYINDRDSYDSLADDIVMVVLPVRPQDDKTTFTKTRARATRLR